MRNSEYIEMLRARNIDEERISEAIENVTNLDIFLSESGRDIDSILISSFKRYSAALVAGGENTIHVYIDLARYFHMTGQYEVYIYLLSTINGIEVLESISEKLALKTDPDTRNRVFDGIDTPPLGSPPASYPPITCRLVERLMELGPENCHNVLADNHHRIPHDSFREQQKLWEESASIDEFLKILHSERIRILQKHLDEGKVWFEQEITPQIIDYVKSNQEILSAVRKDNYLYVTKIPYSPDEWLRETDPEMKRYYACHCPLAREAIIMNGPEIPLDWCYCSGGFAKYLFDVIFGESTEVEVLNSVLAGDDICRFRIKLPEKIIRDMTSTSNA